jgi:hypothetical protein
LPFLTGFYRNFTGYTWDFNRPFSGRTGPVGFFNRPDRTGLAFFNRPDRTGLAFFNRPDRTGLAFFNRPHRTGLAFFNRFQLWLRRILK